MKIVSNILLFIILTILTQIGGLVFLLCILLYPYVIKKSNNRLACIIIKPLVLLVTYLVISFTIVPFIAEKFGRVPLPIIKSESGISPNNILTCLLNRQYVRKEMLVTLNRISQNIKKQNGDVSIYYLDASFPFVNGFPLLPHWSHNDGRKLDLTYYYFDKNTKTEIPGSPSWIGYGFCEGPTGNEVCTTCECVKKGFYQYDILRHLVPSHLHDLYEVNSQKTIQLIRTIAADPSISMIFIEPHLKQRWHLTDIDKIRFHGCHAVRHDDHIHIQIK